VVAGKKKQPGSVGGGSTEKKRRHIEPVPHLSSFSRLLENDVSEDRWRSGGTHLQSSVMTEDD
jgi:hypothetical protein